MHSKVASALKVFTQDLGTLLLIYKTTSWRSELWRAFKVMGHQAKLMADSRGGGSRGRCRWVVRVGYCCCSCGYCCSPLCLHEALSMLMLEQSGKMWIRSQCQVWVRPKCHSLPTLLVLLLLGCQLPPRVPCEGVWSLGWSLRWTMEPLSWTNYQPSTTCPQICINGP